MSYSSLLAFGDSTTAGCELIKGCFDWEKTKPLSFSNQLADKLKIPCYNYGWSGGSNDRSLRLLPEALLEHPDSLVLFTYTSFDRYEFFTTNNYFPQDHTGYFGVGNCWETINGLKEHRQLNKVFLSNFYDPPDNHNRYKIYNTMVMVDLICKQYSANYLHIFLYNSLLLPPDYQEKVYNIIDKEKIFKFDFAQDGISWKVNNQGYGSLIHWARKKGFPFCPGGHIGQEAHDNFAIELYNKI
jgi:hypothetical protein